MRFAMVGCGYVADFYMMTLASHPELELAGVFDIDAARLEQFSSFYSVDRFDCIEAILNDPSIEMVVNLTNPARHYELSMLCLAAGKHVYSEKPLAMDLAQACTLVKEAQQRGLLISSAPSSLLGEAAQTLWKAIRDGYIGEPRLILANMEDDMPFRMGCHLWRNKSGAPWPYADEFEVGVVLEHAGYVLTWLVAFFGPIRTISGSSAVLYPDKMPGEAMTDPGPDFASATILFEGGQIARVSCSLIANEDRSMHIFGTKRTLVCEDLWSFRSPLYSWVVRPTLPNLARKVYNRIYSILEHRAPSLLKVKIARLKGTGAANLHHKSQMDFLAGPSDLADAIRSKRQPRLSPEFCLHVNEAALALSALGEEGSVYRMTTRCGPVAPMPWAT